VVFRHPTKAPEDTINNGRDVQVTAPGFVQMESGGPRVIDNGQVVGAIGARGESKQQDSQVAEAGLTAISGQKRRAFPLRRPAQ
jgi:glc operon protein GlcG